MQVLMWWSWIGKVSCCRLDNMNMALNWCLSLQDGMVATVRRPVLPRPIWWEASFNYLFIIINQVAWSFIELMLSIEDIKDYLFFFDICFSISRAVFVNARGPCSQSDEYPSQAPQWAVLRTRTDHPVRTADPTRTGSQTTVAVRPSTRHLHSRCSTNRYGKVR